MPNSLDPTALAQLRCPKCETEFRFPLTAGNKEVTCPQCEARFLAEEGALIRGAKKYPGERSSDLTRFHKISATDQPHSTQDLNYRPTPELHAFTPATSQRGLLGFLGLVIFLASAAFLACGIDADPKLTGIEFNGQLTIAAFAALIGSGLVFASSRKHRMLASLSALLGSAALLWIPWRNFSPARNEQQYAATTTPIGNKTTDNALPPNLTDTIGLEPLLKENAKISKNGGKPAVGIWLRGLQPQYKTTVFDFIIRVTHASPSSHAYPRANNNYLLVLAGADESLESIAQKLEKIGPARLHPEIQVVETIVDNSRFIESERAKADDPTDFAFYDLNLREIQSLQNERVLKAVTRLSTAEPSKYREQFVGQMLTLLLRDDIPFKGELSIALMKWSPAPSPAGAAAATVLEQLMTTAKPVPRALVDLLSKEKPPAALPRITALWMENSTAWEGYVANFGPIIEPEVLRRLPQMKGTMRQSAVRVLGRIGTEASIPAIQQLKSASDSDMSIICESALQQIRARQ